VTRFNALNQRFPELSRFARFGLVGASGFVVDVSVSWIAQAALVAAGLGSAAQWGAHGLGIYIAMTWNFFLNRRVTFPDARQASLVAQYTGFCASCSVGAVISYAVRTSLCTLIEFFAQYIIAAVPIGVLAGMTFNYVLCRRFVFKVGDEKAEE